ncbi:MAG: hypothetical protein IJK42_03515 [Prevotella sp.]|nr:hypothetical protein [Prevotella sp.]MBQ6208831.1 hypothetical protein [Prevotella sp.]
MNTTIDQPFNLSFVPPMWQLCFCDGCPRHAECLRYATGQHVPEDRTWGPAIFPTAYRNGPCRHFKAIRTVKAAYGFAPLFREVKQKDFTPLRNKMKAYLGGHGTYYRYNRGERLLTPAQQQWILDLFARHGYTEGLAFAHYVEVIDFS